MPSVQHLVGVDIGGTKCAVSLARWDGKELKILDKVPFPTDVGKGPQPTLDAVLEAVASLLSGHGLEPSGVSGIGISCGGPLDSEAGVILSPPNLVGWDCIPIVDIVERRFAIPTRLQNDANACCLAEWRFGVAKGCKNVIFLTFGTGMGAGIILDGKLYGGTNGMAGEIGHVRLEDHGPVGYGKEGSFEGFCSGAGLAQLAATKALEKFQRGESVSFCPSVDDLPRLSAKSVAEAALGGDPVALEVYRTSGRKLGRGLALLVDLLNPQIIVIGSVFSRSRDLLWPSVQATLEAEALPRSLAVCSIVADELGDELGDYGALAVALTT